MYHITKHIAWFAIIATLIIPILCTGDQDYSYQDASLSRPLKIYNNMAIDSNDLEDIVHDMCVMSGFLQERKKRTFFPFHAKHPLLIQGYIRKIGIHNVPQDLIHLINTHIPNHRIQRSTYFFLSDSIIDLIDIMLTPFAGLYDEIIDKPAFLVLLSKKNPELFKQTYSAYCTLREFFIEYDPKKKDYEKGFDYGLRRDAMIQCAIQSRKSLEQRNRWEHFLILEFMGLNELSGNEIGLLKFCKCNSTFSDIIDVINFANGAEAHNHCEIEQYYNEEDLEAFEGVPKKMNKNWSILPDDINFYNQYDGIEQGLEYQLLDPKKPIGLMSNGVASYMHTNGFFYFRIYFSAIPLIKHVVGGSN